MDLCEGQSSRYTTTQSPQIGLVGVPILKGNYQQSMVGRTFECTVSKQAHSQGDTQQSEGDIPFFK